MRSLVNGGEVLSTRSYRIFLGHKGRRNCVISKIEGLLYSYVSYTFWFGKKWEKVVEWIVIIKLFMMVWIKAILKTKLDSGSSWFSSDFHVKYFIVWHRVFGCEGYETLSMALSKPLMSCPNQLSTEKDITGNGMNVLIQTKWTFQSLFNHLMVWKRLWNSHLYLHRLHLISHIWRFNVSVTWLFQIHFPLIWGTPSSFVDSVDLLRFSLQRVALQPLTNCHNCMRLRDNPPAVCGDGLTI